LTATKSTQSPDRTLLAFLFALDARALAVVRVGLATIVIGDSIDRLVGGGADVLGTYSSVLLLPIAGSLLVGWKTRPATALCWLLYGMPIRQGLIEPGVNVFLGQYVLLLFLFWGIFLPMGAWFSLDARTQSERPVAYLSVASAAALIQVFFVYFFAGLNKDMGEWIFQATAMEDILGRSRFGNALGRSVAQAEGAMAVFSVLTIALEIVGSLLLFIPGRGLSKRRVWLVAAFISFHIGMALFMHLRTFPIVMVVVWLLFLPTSFWDRFIKVTTSREPTVDRNRLRNAIAAVALGYVVISNYLTWAFFPPSGFVAQFQEAGIYLPLYQQWAMFSIPSTIS
jgi:hypothetical protein